MKRLMIVLLSIGCLFACSAEKVKKEELDSSYPQKWQLVKMTGSMINSVTTGKDMSWQEYYVFNADGTFLKSRETNGQTKEGSGTYSYTTSTNEKYISLTYKLGTDLIASCYTAQKQEQLIIVSTNKLVGTWNECDGPGLEYELVGQVVID